MDNQVYTGDPILPAVGDLTNSNSLFVSQIPAGVSLAIQAGQPVPTLSIFNANGQEVFREYQLFLVGDLRGTALTDTSGNAVLKTAYRISNWMSDISVCFPNDAPFGELRLIPKGALAYLPCCLCCIGNRETFSFHLSSGKNQFNVQLIYPMCANPIEINVCGEKGESCASLDIGMANYIYNTDFKQTVELKFTNNTLANQDKITILALCLGVVNCYHDLLMRRTHNYNR